MKPNNELREKITEIRENWDFSPHQDEDTRITRVESEILVLIQAEVLKARVDELDKKLPSVIGYDVLFANPNIGHSVEKRIDELEAELTKEKIDE